MEHLDPMRPNIKEPRYLYNGIPVPRVTEIISKMIHEDYLMRWANSLGFKRKSYKTEVDGAAKYGSSVHDSIDGYLDGKEMDPFAPKNPTNAFLKWWKQINDGNHVEILGKEFALTCPWFGGTYDLLLKINGRIFVVDFKTSNHLSYKYCLQLSAYRYMLRLGKICEPDGIIILQLRKDIPDFNEVVLDFSNKQHLDLINHCENTFLSLTYSYYHILEAERLYKLL